MDGRALRRAINAELRPQAWRGTYPHIHRTTSTRVDSIDIQFSSSGGEFTLNASVQWLEGAPAPNREMNRVPRLPVAGRQWTSFAPPTFAANLGPALAEKFGLDPNASSQEFNADTYGRIMAPYGFETRRDLQDEHFDQVASLVVRTIQEDGPSFFETSE